MKKLLVISALLFSMNGLAIETDVKNGDLGGGITILYEEPYRGDYYQIVCLAEHVYIQTPRTIRPILTADGYTYACDYYKETYIDKED